MPLGLQTEVQGDFEARIQYDAKMGLWVRVDRLPNAQGGFDKFETDITNAAQFAMDFANIKVGWLKFASDGVDFQTVPLPRDGSPPALPHKPSKDHRQGFIIRLKLGRSAGGDVRQWAHTAKCVLAEMDALHGQVIASPEFRSGMVPVIHATGTKLVRTQSQKGEQKNLAPIFTIASWIARPPEFDAKPNGAAATNGHAAPASPPPPPPYVPPPQQTVPAATYQGTNEF